MFERVKQILLCLNRFFNIFNILRSVKPFLESFQGGLTLYRLVSTDRSHMLKHPGNYINET